ncbi:unnamed protein product [Musa hybrid cultivar]
MFTKFVMVNISINYLEGAWPLDKTGNDVSYWLNCLKNAMNQRSPDDCLKFYRDRGLPYDGYVIPSALPSDTCKKEHWNLKYILTGTLGGVLALAILVLLLICYSKRHGFRQVEQQESGGAAASSGGGRQAPGVYVNLTAVGKACGYEQLVRATAGFSGMNLVKHGRSGGIYHGALENGLPIVVKRINVLASKDARVVKLDLFSNGLHERLVPFLGHCLGKEKEKFLVYKYVPNGDLYTALQRKPEPEGGVHSLDWIKRLKIATGIAQALYYLHHECSPLLVHRDIQTSSILLDDKFEVRLGSLSEVCPQEEAHHSVIAKLLRMSQSSEQSVSKPPATCAYDVHCLGKVLLELVTGKLGISGSNDAAANEWLDDHLPCIDVYEKELVTKIVDPFLVVDEDHLEEVWAMAIIGKSCLNPKPNRRPPASYVLKALENPVKVVREDDNSGSARG